jgi:hypothetical protein
MGNLLNLIEVVKSQLLKIHDIFFATTPANVTIKRIAEDNSVEEVEIPNIAKINADLLAAGNVIPLSGSGDAAEPVTLTSPESLILDDNSGYLILLEIFGYSADDAPANAFMHHRASVGVRIAAGSATLVTKMYNYGDGGYADVPDHAFNVGGGELTVGVNASTRALEVKCTHFEEAAVFWGTAKIKKMVA